MMISKKNVISLVCIAGAVIAVASCGSNSGGSSAGSTSEWLTTFAQGLAVASPTANSSTTLSSLADESTFDSSADFKTKAEAIANIAKATSTDGCKISLPQVGSLGERANCFGPQVTYSSHPDGADQTPAQLPGGDLGIWNSTESDGTACAASQMNTLVGAAAKYVDTALLMQAGSICVLGNNGVAKPAAGESVDFTADFSSALNSEKATVTSAKVTAIDDSTYEYKFEGTTDGTKTYFITIRHKADDTENASYSGRIYGYWTTGTSRNGFSVKYSKVDSDLSARMVAGQYSSTVEASTIFNTDGDIAMSGWSNNMNHAIFKINSSTGVGSVSYAWQAGSGDSHTRVFNVYTSGEAGSLTGCGFFGYGNAFSTTLADNTNAISGFICNWAGPGNQDHASAIAANAHKAQKQCFTQNAQGVFAPVSGKNKIRYAPANSCDENSSFTYQWPTSLGDNTTTDNVTNDLVTLTSDTAFSSYTAPTAP